MLPGKRTSKKVYSHASRLHLGNKITSLQDSFLLRCCRLLALRAEGVADERDRVPRARDSEREIERQLRYCLRKYRRLQGEET